MRGHVRKRGKKWCIVIPIGVDGISGKYKYKWFSGYDTKKEAEKDLPAKLQEIQNGLVVRNKETVESFIRDWSETKATQVRQNTMRTYNWLINTHIVPNLGRIELSKLTPKHLQNLYTKMRTAEKPVSARTIQQTHVILHDALDRALKWGLITRNVSEAVDPPKPERKQTGVWTIEQALDFLEANKKERVGIGFHLAIMTGMRKGEILALRWSDIDFENGYIRVQQTLTWVKGNPLFQEPKTDRSRRSVALFEDDIAELRKYKAKQAREKLRMGSAYEDHGLVIARVDGRPMNPRTFDDAWYRSLERVEVPKIRFHDLRHTHASLLLQQGVHLKIVSERLGHSNINITGDLYSHVLPGLQKKAIEQLGTAMKRAKEK